MKETLYKVTFKDIGYNMITLTAQRLDDGIIEKAIIQLEQGEKVGFKATYPNFTIRKNEQQEWYDIMSRKGYELYRIAFEGRDYSYVFFKKTA